MNKLFGWAPDPEGTAAILADRGSQVWRMGAEHTKALAGAYASDKEPVLLFDALLPLQPNWNRGAQGIGDCVSWGYELACTLAHAVDIMIRGEPWLWSGPYSTEPIYGGSRVEARGVNRGGYQDGSYGAAAAKWLTKWGALHRIDYSLLTGDPDHDLRLYSSSRAKEWGNYGCGGKSDNGKLDKAARQCPVRKAYLVTSFEQAAAAVENGYPVAVCSGQGFGKRGAGGFAPASGSWAHCMTFTGVRYDKPALLLTNSWGNSWGTKAPFYPKAYYASVQKCSAWVEARTVDRMLSSWEDSFAITGVDGLKRREIDWRAGWKVSGR